MDYVTGSANLCCQHEGDEVALTPDEQQPAGRGLAMVDWLADWSERIVDGRREVRAELTL